MSIHVALHHLTRYRYDRPIKLAPQTLRLRPCPHTRTRITSYSLRVLPEQHFINWLQDPQSNYLARLVFPERASELCIEVDLIAEITVINPFDFFLEPYAEQFPFDYEMWQQEELAPYCKQLPLTPKFAAWLQSIDRSPKPSVYFLVDLNRALFEHIDYVIRLEPGVQTPEETLAKGSGSCRDSAWLLVQTLRHLGLAARFVSGYLIQLKADVKSLDGPCGPAADFTDLHAWCEVFLPGAGWIGLDPTSGLFAGEGHLPLACTPDPFSAAPISGALEDCEVTFEHQMKLTRIRETPRVTLPCSEQQWGEIERLGLAIDAQLDEMDVRLTQGGEPTFISIDDADGDEWNTDALGPTKRSLAATLFYRLRDHYAAHGLVHFGQGKWYPGEPLPRWSLNCFWREDGEPIWEDPALSAHEGTDYAVDEERARQFLEGIAARLGLDPQRAFPVYEDVLYYLWRERKLPSNVDPFDSKLADPLERKRLLRLFGGDLAKATGHVLPLARDPRSGAWQSTPWFLRDQRCYLVPGDSPLGYRLPLDSLPWVSDADYPWIHAPDPFEAARPLPPHALLKRQFGAHRSAATQRRATGGSSAGAPGRPSSHDRLTLDDRAQVAPGAQESAARITRTAMCTEARNGVLHVFMPPTETVEDYLELVAAVEATAAALDQAVLLEGYDMPRDPRIRHFRITPDPGVIEVNIQPARNWSELVEHTTHLYDAAHHARLSTEKFMLDGRHTGTGGGNHIVLGGLAPADSPFLRRPDLLRSLVSYWHNHPSLSYLFSGLFIGPSSQAPRIDEARNDTVFEIEIAFREMERLCPSEADTCPAWMVDRLMRNLLTDVTGNTHRAEFCIDKLYSPDGPAGRLGLLELRAFEMPPHARMSLTQQLLLRALVARFWKTPYAPLRLARWGTALHDRFLLPHFVWQDFRDVIEETRAAGYPIREEWFAPHFEFRFPQIGDLQAAGVTLELRTALEPWHVMGEEGAIGRTVRHVDSSVERVQVKVDGVTSDRYRVTCNGVPVPLQPGGSVGGWVAGVKYRAWQPPSCLHPTIGVHSPLSFDIVDTWMSRSLGGCQYHVMHPGGRHFESRPVNAFAAESRRMTRFFRMGHTPGPIEACAARVNPEFPFTLDLREY